MRLHRGSVRSQALWMSAGLSLLLGCSAADEAATAGSHAEDLQRAKPAPPGRHGSPPRGHGNGPGHGHGHAHGPGHPHGPGCSGNGNGSGNGSGGASSSAGSSSGGSSSSSGGFGGSTSGTGGGNPGGGVGGGAPGVCGDSMYGGNEQCDDGNALSGDGCSSLCQLEPHYACYGLGEPCTLVVCGDGLQQGYLQADGSWASEDCDDGNGNSGDGCSSTCVLEPGWICEPGVGCRQVTCGDGRQDGWFEPGPGGGTAGSGGVGGGGSSGTYHYEECDDGNVASGDGCSATCALEEGWVCPQPDTACHQPTCGDGLIDFIPGRPGGGSDGGSSSGGFGGGSGGFGGGAVSGSYEECDDANTAPGDGCDASCSVEPGWGCPYWMGLGCHPIVCGDGFVDYPSESCEDGNSVPNDGCTNCQSDYQGTGGAGGFGPQPTAGGGFGAQPGGGFGGG